MNSDIQIDFEALELLFKLEKRDGINDEISCFDYIETIYKIEDGWVVGLFIEPVGLIKIKAESLIGALNFWLELLRNQPDHWEYRKAGWHLLDRMPGEVFDVNDINPIDLWNP